jgi:hypothetical protein
MAVISKVMHDGNGSYVIRNGQRIDIKVMNPEPGQKIRRRREDTFVQVPLQLAAKMAAATNTPKAIVCTWLLYQAWRTKSRQFAVPNEALTSMGVTSKVKNAALRQLERAGIIAVEWRSRKSPIVTLL